LRFFSNLAVVALTLFVFVSAPLFALAEQIPSTTVDLDPAVQSLLGYVSAAISALVAATIGILTARFYRWAGINIEAKDREALHSAIMTGVNAGLGKVAGMIGGRAVDVHSTVLAEALRYVLASVPDAIRRFGLTDDRLRQMITAKLVEIERKPPHVVNVAGGVSVAGQAA
jgi:hypothetical protein